MKNPSPLLLAPFMLCMSALAYGNTVYTYNGPNFTGLGDHLSISFATSTPLLPSKSYITQASANVVSGYVSVLNANGIVPGLNVPIETFQVHTDSAGNIDAWDILGGSNNLTGQAPTMQGTDTQAYSMNTLVFIPGSDIPGAIGLVTGAYNYEQATIINFYSSCANAPVGANCTLAGNGQPYASSYGGIINPAHTDGSWWQISQDTNNPPPVTLNINGTFPNGTVGTAYNTSLTVTNGTPPYNWTATGLPAGLLFSNGIVSGSPTTVGTYSVNIGLTDSTQATASHAYTVVINPAAPPTCTNKDAVITSVGRNFIVVNGGLNVADHVWYTPTAAGTTFTGGTTGFVTGELVDFTGTLDAISGCYATSMTVKPAPTVGNYTVKDEGRKKITAFGDHYVFVGSKRIIWDSNTLYTLHATQIKVGMVAEWKGLRDKATNIVLAKSLVIN
ncbi:MAG: Ig domain-containing protein [Methylovulum sp.]|nr:Ig domain-containing protein [Methylovulum sp.]